MKLLLTGAAGKLGRAILAEAAGQHEIIALDLVKPPPELCGDGVEVIEGDFANRDLLRERLPGCDAVIHTAAAHPGNTDMKDRAAYFRVNVAGTDAIYELMAELGVPRMVYSSSIEVQIGRSWATNGACILDEESPIALDTIYNLTKWQCEQLAHYWHTVAGIRVACMRYMGFGYTPPDDPRFGIGLLARNLAPRDVARANLLAAESDRVFDDMINIGPKTPICEQADVILGLTDPEAVIEKHFPGAVEIMKKAGAPITPFIWPITRIVRARQILGWEPEYTFAAWLEEIKEKVSNEPMSQ